MEVTLVVAHAADGCIGIGGQLPWRLPDDLKRFRAVTMGKPVIMGRKTWESLPVRPLKGRRNIVVTRSGAFLDGAETAGGVEEALRLASEAGAAEAMVIGGGEIYALAAPYATRIEATAVAVDVPGGDAFFTLPDPSRWRVQAEEHHAGDPAFVYRTFVRI